MYVRAETRKERADAFNRFECRDLGAVGRAARNGGAEQPVFPSRTGRRLDRGRVRVILRRAARLAGVSAAMNHPNIAINRSDLSLRPIQWPFQQHRSVEGESQRRSTFFFQCDPR
jgi:hypothetical protein